MARFFKNPPRSGSALALPGIAEGLRRLAYAVENLTVINGTVSWSARGAPIISMEGSDGETGDDAQVAQRRFHCTIKDGDALRVSEGSVRFHGIGTAHCNAVHLACQISPAWVYVQVARESLTATIGMMSTEPESDYLTLRLPLCVIESEEQSDGRTIWRIKEICHMGDFDFDLPLR